MKVTLIGLSSALYNQEKLADGAAALCVDKYESCLYNDLNTHMNAAITSGHLSVIEHLPLTFLIEDISRACSHQLVRHRHFSFSQQSQRYAKVDTSNEWYVIPESIKVNTSLGFNKDQNISVIRNKYDCLMYNIAELYKKMCEAGIPNEDARFILPNACHTSIMISMNSRAFVEASILRLCNKAQWEVREVFKQMRNLIKNAYPTIYELAKPNCMKDGCKEKKRCKEGYAEL